MCVCATKSDNRGMQCCFGRGEEFFGRALSVVRCLSSFVMEYCRYSAGVRTKKRYVGERFLFQPTPLLVGKKEGGMTLSSQECGRRQSAALIFLKANSRHAAGEVNKIDVGQVFV